MVFTYPDISKWVLEWEGPTLEFKINVPQDIGETISAFANTYGGIIIFGVDSKKREKRGLLNPDEESRRLRQSIDLCKPYPTPKQEFVSHDAKTFIVLQVEALSYSQNPCFYKKKCYIRQGTTNLELSGEELIDYLKKRAILNFEESKSKASLSDLDLNKVNRLLKARKIKHEGLSDEDYRKILSGLGVANANGEFFLKNVAILFFSKEPQKFSTNLEVRIVRYGGLTPDLTRLRFDQRIQGTIPDLISNTFNALCANVGRTLALFGPERKEIPEYPLESLREVITNSLGHRDFFNTESVLIEIFDDRLQITNPGGLLMGQTITNFDKTPQHRNPILYRLLHDFGLGEGLGLGIRLIRSQFREQKLPDPEFYDIGNRFQVILYNNNSDKKRHPPKLENNRQKQVLAYLQKNKRIKAADFAKIVGKTLPTALKDLNELIKQGKIKKIGKFRGAYYEIIKTSK
jgi:ATP-dependent DNA helicase RecG